MRVRIITTFLLIFLFFAGACCNQSKIVPGANDSETAVSVKDDKVDKKVVEKLDFQPPEKYENLTGRWDKVVKNEQKGKPRSAKEEVLAILKEANVKNNVPQIVKAVIHKTKYAVQIGEKEFPAIIMDLEKEVKEASFPVKPILQSLLAEMYRSYFNANRYKFYQRTKTGDSKPDDVATWDLRTIMNRISELYLESIVYSENLKEIRIDLFDEIVNKGTRLKSYRPTLYDFLAHRAVDFFIVDQHQLVKPSFVFEVDDEEFFSPAERFAFKKISSKEGDSLTLNALVILKELTAFHLQDVGKVDALVDVELKRLEFVYRKTVLENKKELYISALKKLEEKYKKNDAVAMVKYFIAKWYRDRGNEWIPYGPEEHRWSIKKAYEICKDAVDIYPDSEGALMCRAFMGELTYKTLSLQAENVNLPDRPFLMNVTYKGVEKLHFKALKILPEHQRILDDNKLNYKKKYRKLLDYKPYKQWTSNIPDDGDLRSHTVALKVPELELGRYIIFGGTDSSFSFDKQAVNWFFTDISNLSFTHSTIVKGKSEIFVFDRDSGKPLKNVNVKISMQQYSYKKSRYVTRVLAKLKTDKNGRAPFKVNRKDQYSYTLNLELKKGKDKLKSSFYSYNNNHAGQPRNEVHFFTDRGIYRPGQTIYFKGIMLKKDKDQKPQIVSGVSTTVLFLDRNWQKVSELKVKTNEYGTFSGNFIAPTGVMNGNMTISNVYGSKSISVEEYKRPKFETKFKPVKDNFKINDIVKVKGSTTSYSGAPLSDAKVKYTVTRRTWFPYNWWSWWYRMYNNKTVVIKNGEVKTKADGEYEVEFMAMPDEAVPASAQPSFSYTVQATVTDINGETHSTSTVVNVGFVALSISTSVLPTINSQDKFEFTIHSSNLNGEFEQAKGSLKIWRISEPARLLRSRKLAKPDRFVMKKEEFTKLFPHDIYSDEDDIKKRKKAEKTVDISFDTKKSKKVIAGDISGWKDGNYTLEIHTKDRFGSEIKYKHNFIVTSSVEGEQQRNIYNTVSLLDSSVEPGKSARILLGTAADNVEIVFDILRKNKKPERKRVSLDRSKKLLEIPVSESDRGGVGYRWMFQKHGRFFSGKGQISVPWSNKVLKTEFLSFRNKLKPGEKEEWRIKISGPEGEKVAAEMVAAMYDASLDTFRSNSFYLNTFPYYGFYEAWQTNNTNSLTYSQQINDGWNSYVSYPSLYYDSLNLFGLNFYSRGRYYRRSAMKMSKSKAAPMKKGEVSLEAQLRVGDSYGVGGLSMNGSGAGGLGTRGRGESESLEEAKELVADKSVVGASTLTKSVAQTKAPEKKVQIRKNLQETAFFYPFLRTNEKSEIIVSFTIPEALTRWKMIGFAHTKDLKTASLTNSLITQKELMVTPNVPRFLREMDTVYISTKISNLTDKKLNGTAELKLFNALNEKPIDKELHNIEQIKKFTVDKKGNTAVSWKLNIPEGIEAVTWRIIAKGGEHSDGEESTIPVLSNRMMVTESMPLPVNGNETKEFLFKKLVNSKDSKTLSHHRLTLEFTSNPVWYAVQALPYLMEYPHECAEQIFSRYYANSLASYIVNSNPKIQKVFDQWKGTDALLSNLQKNQELKSLLLEETPWVLEAQSEEQQKKRRKEEAERKKLEKLKKKRDAQKRKKAKNKRATLEKNAGKLERARDLVLEMCSGGKYNKAIKAIIKVSKIKCECEEDAKILALKTQLLNFNKVRKKIQQGVELLNGSLILDNIEAAQALDQEIVEGGTSFSEKVEKITAVGYYAKGLEMEKKDNYILANEFFEKCNSADPDKKECADWLENKDKIVKKLYDKAAVMKNFAPSKAKNLFRAILKLVTAEHEFYKKAEKDLQKMEY